MSSLLSFLGITSTPTANQSVNIQSKQVSIADMQKLDYRAQNTYSKFILLNISKANIKKDASVPQFKKKKSSYNRFLIFGCYATVFVEYF